MRLVNLKDFGIYFFRLFNTFIFNILGCRIKGNFFYQSFIFFDNKKFLLKFVNKIFFRKFVWMLTHLINSIRIGYHMKLYLKGLGFRIRQSKKMKRLKIFKFWLGHSVYKYIFSTPLFFLRRDEKLYLLIYTPFLMHLNDFLVHVFLLRVIRPYKKVRGVIDKRQLFFMRPAKIR
jgi:hypothetical protein